MSLIEKEVHVCVWREGERKRERERERAREREQGGECSEMYQQ